MSLADEGGYDLVMEVAQQLVTEIVSEAPTPTETATVSFAGVTGTMSLDFTVDQVTIGAFPNVAVTVDLTGTQITATSVPAFLAPVPDSLRTIAIDGDVIVTVPLRVAGLTLVADFGSAGAPNVTQAVFDSILAAPLVQFLLVEALLTDPTGGLYQITLQTIETTVSQQVQLQLATIGPITLLDATSFSTSLQSAIGTGINGFDFNFGSESIFLLFTIGGTPGRFSAISRSDLLRNSSGEPADRADLIVSNACFLRDFMRPALSETLNLTTSGFLSPPPFFPGAPFFWLGNVAFPAAVSGPITSADITEVVIGIDGSNVRIAIVATAGGIGGVFSVSATIGITVSLSLAISGGTLTITLSPVGAPTVNSNVSIPWWVYVAGFAIGGFGLDAIVAAANAFGGNLANSVIASAISSQISTRTVSLPVPAGVSALTVRALNLSQSDAFPSLVMNGSMLLSLPFPQDDIIANFI